MVFLHPHESSISVGLGKAISVSEAMIVVVVSLLTTKVVLYLFQGLLQGRFSLPLAVDKGDTLPMLQRFELFAQLLKVLGLDGLPHIKTQPEVSRQ